MHLVGFTIELYYDARPYEHQTDTIVDSSEDFKILRLFPWTNVEIYQSKQVHYVRKQDTGVYYRPLYHSVTV